jgi:hypothetical protein
MPASSSTPVGNPRRQALPVGLAALGLAWSGVALLDPGRPSGITVGPLLAVAGYLIGRRRDTARSLMLPGLLAIAFATAAAVGPEFRADSPSYFAYLRSLAFDGDLDFADEWERWGFPEQPVTATGLRRNVHSVGPAVLWSPFFALAHVYVKVDGLLGGSHAADGYSLPYRRATALGTLAAVVVGAVLLYRLLARTTIAAIALLAVAAAVLASPILYYAFVVPSMAHGATFGAAAALLWAWDRAGRAPSLGAWMLVGALLGSASLMRWQSAVYVIPLALSALGALRRGTVRPSWIAAAGGAAVVAFLPQMIAWRILYGRWLTFPQGGGFMDWSSPHLLDTLISADHGLFSWTPVTLLGVIGLLLGARRSPGLHGGGVLVFAVTAWINGGAWDWSAGDAFGARRFDVVVPLVAVGLATILHRALPFLVRWPLAAPAALLVLLSLWNAGLVALVREGRYPGAAPLDRLAADQVRWLRRGAEGVLGHLAGARGRAIAYKALVGEYFYVSGFHPGGTILLPGDDHLLLEGWSAPHRRPDGPGFRWALHPEACVRVPLESPIELPVVVTARAPRGAEPQVLSLAMNGTVVGTAPVDAEWCDLPFTVPVDASVPGENRLCLRFLNAAPGEAGGRAAAAVWRIQLP